MKLSGNRTIAKALAIAVIEIDNAVLPLARWVTKFDIAPPGQQATKIIPNSMPVGKSKNIVSKVVNAGNAINWALNAAIIAFGI